MREIIMSNTNVRALVDDEDYDIVRNYTWCMQRSGMKRYVTCTVGNTTVYLHSLILVSPSSELTVDHIDRKWFNCTKGNLRLATKQQQTYNQDIRITNTSGYKGVCRDHNKRKWKASIRVAKKRIFLGYFDKAEDAGAAYDKAALLYHGEFAYNAQSIKEKDSIVN